MPKNKFQDVVFTIIMATIMVYGMVVYNVALNTCLLYTSFHFPYPLLTDKPAFPSDMPLL